MDTTYKGGNKLKEPKLIWVQTQAGIAWKKAWCEYWMRCDWEYINQHGQPYRYCKHCETWEKLVERFDAPEVGDEKLREPILNKPETLADKLRREAQGADDLLGTVAKTVNWEKVAKIIVDECYKMEECYKKGRAME